MSQTSNDCKGLTYVGNDAGQILFRRPELTASGALNQTAQATTNMAGWVKLASPALGLYGTIATGTGAVTVPVSSTATTGPERIP